MDGKEPCGDDRPSQITSAAPNVWYVIDAGDRLVEASDGYFEFAARNQFPGARKSLGKPLWDCVSDETTRLVQMSLIRRVRRSGRTLALPFRCDGPTVRRELTLEIERPVGARSIQFSAVTVLEEPRPRQALLDLSSQRGTGTITMCSWCDRFAVEGAWVEVERAVDELGLTSGIDLPEIKYDLCLACTGVLSRG